MGRLDSLENFINSYGNRINELGRERTEGRKIVGTFCLYVPDEIIFAAGADRVVLCGGKSDTIPLAEEYLPRSVCPLIKSSFGAVVSSATGAHPGLVKPARTSGWSTPS